MTKNVEEPKRSIKAIFGSNVKARRRELRIAQKDLAVELAISQDALSRIEHGHMGPKLERLDDFARALDCPISRFFFDPDQKVSEEAKTIEELIASMPEVGQQLALDLVRYMANCRMEKNRANPLRVDLSMKEIEAKRAAKAVAEARKALKKAERAEEIARREALEAKKAQRAAGTL